MTPYGGGGGSAASAASTGDDAHVYHKLRGEVSRCLQKIRWNRKVDSVGDCHGKIKQLSRICYEMDMPEGSVNYAEKDVMADYVADKALRVGKQKGKGDRD